MYKSELKSEIRFWRCEILLSRKAHNFDFAEEKDGRNFYEDVTRKHRETDIDDLVSIESNKGLFSFHKDMLSSVSLCEKIIDLKNID